MFFFFVSVHGGEVELLHWFCSGFDDKLPKKIKRKRTKKYFQPIISEFGSLQEKPGWFSCKQVGFGDLKKD